MGKCILLVDDDLASLELSCQVLETAGHLVVAVSTGLEARQALDAIEFDVIVTDIFMPDMDGLELIRHICGHDLDVAIIAISGGSCFTREGFLPIALAMGADLVLQKPVLPGALRRAVERVAIDRTKGMRCRIPEPSAASSVSLAGQGPGFETGRDPAVRRASGP
jgi:CheY-like chemotaxis protein